MSQGDFTKLEAARSIEHVSKIFLSIHPKKRVEMIGRLNDVLLFLESAKKAAPEAVER
jgi:hypothetical protein